MSKNPVIGVNMACREIPEHPGRRMYEVQNLYVDPILKAGGIPLLIPPVEEAGILEQYLDKVDAMLFIGGKDYLPALYGESPAPETDLTRAQPMCDPALMKRTLERRLPLLGICAGCQLFAIGAGGKLIQHLPNTEKHIGGVFHSAEITEDGALSRTLGLRKGAPFQVYSYHHQAVKPEGLPPGLRITARAFDGSIEAIEGTGGILALGVQFHPERMPELAPKFFRLLVGEARKRK